MRSDKEMALRMSEEMGGRVGRVGDGIHFPLFSGSTLLVSFRRDEMY
jgi:hypothetical protein